MASMYECPRCGSGIRPGDTQCGRCGERLVEGNMNEAMEASSSVTINTVFSEKKTSVRMDGGSNFYSLSEMKERLEEQERKLLKGENDLKERENEILLALEEIEYDTAAMEEAISRYEEDRAQLHKRENMMKGREVELDVMVKELNEKNQKVEDVLNGLKARGFELDDLESLIREKDRCQKIIGEERDKIRAEYEQKMAESMERLKEVKEKAKKIDMPIEAIEQAPKPLDIDALLREISADLQVQIGADSEGVKDVGIVSTGNHRFDDILGGGLPMEQIILVNGQPGTMKSTLSFYMIQQAAKQGVRSMYFSLEQTRESLLRQMEGIGINQNDEGVIVVDMVDLRKSMDGDEGDWRDILKRYVKNVHAEREFDIFVLDSMEAFKAMTEFNMGRQELKDYFDWLRDLGMTVILITENRMQGHISEDCGELYLSDGIIELIMKELDNNQVQRWLRVMKMRGMDNDARYFNFNFVRNELEVSTPLMQSSFSSGTF